MKTSLKTLVALMTFFLLSVPLFAQTGPGGVGSTDGSSDLRWWYDANHESYTDGASVNSVSDLSGYGNSLSASGTEQPTFEETIASINDKDAFVFDASDDELESTYQGNSNEVMSYIIVMQQGSTNADVRVAVQQGGRNTVATKSGYAFDYVGAGNHTSNTLTTSNWHIHTSTFSGGTVGTTVTNGITYYQNGSQTDQFNYNIENRTDNTWIGGNGSGGGYPINGKIAEVMKFTKLITQAERTIIENYLSSKYNISITNDKYAGDDAAKGDYDDNVIGIGGTHNESSDTKGLTIKQNSGFINGEYLFAGNNLQVNENIYSDISGVTGLEARWQRIWYFDITGSGNETVDITFDISDGGFSGSAGVASNYKLLYRSGTSGNWTDAGTATSVNGDQITFSSNSLSNGDGYYTIGTLDFDNSTLPIELLSFDAIAKESNVDLHWRTATEINNDYYTIERSQDGNWWEEIAQVPGAGNSNEVLSYDYTDIQPLEGVSYYRLKQTDFNGSFDYSAVRKIAIKQKKEIIVYPNPTENKINIVNFSGNINDIQVYNALGQNLSTQIGGNYIESTNLQLDLSSLPRGVYFISLDNHNLKVFKK